MGVGVEKDKRAWSAEWTEIDRCMIGGGGVFGGLGNLFN